MHSPCTTTNGSFRANGLARPKSCKWPNRACRSSNGYRDDQVAAFYGEHGNKAHARRRFESASEPYLRVRPIAEWLRRRSTTAAQTNVVTLTNSAVGPR